VNILLAQQFVPFQGKLYEDGQVFTGTKSFSFSVPELNWSEQHNNVNVNNGLYAVVLGSITPLPDNFFSATERTREVVITLDGQQLDIVELYAPFEADGDPNNEIQSLRRSGDTLFLSGSNFVLLDNLSGSGSGSGEGKNSDEFFVGPSEVLSSNFGPGGGGNASSVTGLAYQSFTSNQTGNILSVELEFNNLTDADFTLYFTQGVGDGQAINGLFSNYSAADFPATNDGNPQFFTLELKEPIPIQENVTYSFVISVNGGKNMLFKYNAIDSYPNGQSSFGETTDLNFNINMEYRQGGFLSVDQSGTQIQRLRVEERIFDKTGVVMPVGTILAFAGPSSSIPEGWLLCDGKAYDKNQYIDLFNAINVGWGTPSADQFRVPDLRGMFLRGVNGDAEIDPDRSARFEKYSGGNKENNVGSYQKDAFQGHIHRVPTRAYGTGAGANGPYPDAGGDNSGRPVNDGENGEPRYSKETRPYNAYVNYIIKY
jgi:hypothetical protein